MPPWSNPPFWVAAIPPTLAPEEIACEKVFDRWKLEDEPVE
jgi:hypothetical protein